MTVGIQVIWPDSDGRVTPQPFEIEYFCGIDVNHLDVVPEFTTVPALWPRVNGGTPLEYVVDSHCERPAPGEVRLVVTYDPEQNPDVVRQWPDPEDFYWGTNTIILRQGLNSGVCEWVRDGADEFEEVTWKAFDVGDRCARPRATNRGSKREAWFRSVILQCDEHRCVLTGPAPSQALEAAHLIPAAQGQNDVPSNGIALRADLHRLFDAGLFTFDADGRVMGIDPQIGKVYRKILRKCRSLPTPTLQRVRPTLAHPTFADRKPAR